jgi:hypothetical protein
MSQCRNGNKVNTCMYMHFERDQDAESAKLTHEVDNHIVM